MRILLLLPVFSLILLFQSCVTRRSYDAIKSENQRLSAAKSEAEKRSDDLKNKNEQLDRELRSLREETTKLKLDSATSGAMYRKNKQLLNDLFEKYDRLDKSYNQLLANSATERGFLDREASKREKELEKLESDLNKQKADFAVKEALFTQKEAQKMAEIEGKEKEIVRLNEDLKTREKRLTDLETSLKDKDQMVNDLKTKVNSALLGFKQSNFSINIKNGKVYLSLPEQLLFKSGSFKIEAQGTEALKKVATVLLQNPEIEVLVEGHTDDIPLKKKIPGLADNWDLSALRASSVARIFVDQGVPGARISAVGKSEYYAIDPAKNTEARTKNRRLEVILSPKLDELFKVLEAK